MMALAPEQFEAARIAPDSQAYDLPPDRGTLRRKLWSAVIAALEDSRLPYCLLGMPGDIAQITDSDLDFVVRPCDYQRLPQLLATAAASVGGQLVQAIEHETTATYFALALQQHEQVASLHPDCTTDYRREGRLWMSSRELLRRRRRAPAGYFRPAPDVDFRYYLIKQVLKQTVTESQWRKLVALYHAAHNRRQALSCWPLTSAAQMAQILLHNDREGFRNLAPSLRNELVRTPGREGVVAEASSCALNAARVARRLAHPTGLLVQLWGGNREDRTALGATLAKTLAPAFRRASVISSANPAKILRALVESTLVISPGEAIPFGAIFGGIDIQCHAASSLESAITAILSHLSQRTVRRLKLPSTLCQQLALDAIAQPTVF
jgi:hypothetical protein